MIFQAGSEVELSPCVDLISIAAKAELQYFTGADCYNLIQLTKSISLKEYEKTLTEGKLSNGKRAREGGEEEEVSTSKKMKGESCTVMKSFRDEVNVTKGVLKAKHFEEALKEIKPSVTEEVSLVIMLLVFRRLICCCRSQERSNRA